MTPGSPAQRLPSSKAWPSLASERGHGVGTLLLDIVDQHLHEAGVTDVRLSVIVGNTQTVDFYRKRGLVPTLTGMGRHGRP